MKIKTNELTGAALDWAVAKCEGLLHDDGTVSDYWQPSELWEQGGPIIEREKLDVFCSGQIWDASTGDRGNNSIQSGPTPLIAAMRCYVASKMGDEVEVPNELH
jgi:hypothetical protein